MKTEEIELIKSKHNAAIIAPAGHGKTEMITELIDKLPGKKLVLTHTNAGVNALTQRLRKKSVAKEKYNLSTISSFCMRWCNSYPSTAGMDPDINVKDDNYYQMLHSGAVKIFSHEWSRDVLYRTYDYLIVDEYQDCIVNQHKIFVEINKRIPVYVFGDPLQAIFGFKEKLVSWKNLEFEILNNEIETSPWRWDKTNPNLGKYLSDVREQLLPSLDGQQIKLSIIPDWQSIYRIPPQEVHNAKLYQILKEYQSVLYIAKWSTDTIAFAKSTGGKFQNDETQDLKDLYQYANFLDSNDGDTIAKGLFNFILECASNAATELKSYKGHIQSGDYDFHLLKKHKDFGNRIMKVYQTHSHDDMLSVLEWIKNTKIFKLYRKELFDEMQRAIWRSRDRQITIEQAAQEIRMLPDSQSRYPNFKRLASRTLLSKGLEFECVIIDLSKINQGRYTSTDMYVAMTRAMRAIYFIIDQDSVLLDKPEGIKFKDL